MPIERLEDALAAARADRARRRPHVTLAYAQSLDGSLAAEPDRPLRLSCEGALTVTHRIRAMHDAILVGIGTVLADDPRLDVRRVSGRSPRPIVLDSTLRTPVGCALARGGQAWIATTARAPVERRRALERCGLQIMVLPAADGRVDLAALAKELHERGIATLMVEGGERTINSFLAARWIDRILVTVSPQLVAGLTLARSGLPPGLGVRVADWQVGTADADVLLGGRIEFSEARP